jgi:hypothetical protein
VRAMLPSKKASPKGSARDSKHGGSLDLQLGHGRALESLSSYQGQPAPSHLPIPQLWQYRTDSGACIFVLVLILMTMILDIDRPVMAAATSATPHSARICTHRGHVQNVSNYKRGHRTDTKTPSRTRRTSNQGTYDQTIQE